MAAGAVAGAAPRYQRNIVLYSVLDVVNSTAFIASNWIYFWLRVMTYGQLGLIDALGFAFGMLMEIPAGALADLIGKRGTLLTAMALNAVGWTMMGVSTDLSTLVAGFWIAQAGMAFFSGAHEALLYDSLKADGRAAYFDRVYSRLTNLALLVLILSTLAGSPMYHADIRLPHLAWGLSFLVGLFAALFIIEPPRSEQRFSLRAYQRQLIAGLQDLKQPQLRPHLAQMLLSRGVVFMFAMGLVTPIMAIGFGYDVDGQAVLWAFLLLGAMLGVGAAPALSRRWGNHATLTLAGVMIGAGYASAALPLGLLGGVMMVLIRVGGGIALVTSARIINDAIPSETRATTLSTVAMLVRVPYVLTAIIAGSMAEAGLFGLFGLAVGVVMIAVSGWYFVRRKV